MAYQTGSLTDIEDLVSKLATFITGLTTTPWTQDELDLSADKATFHRGNCYVSFKWDAVTSHTLAVYQSLGWSSGQLPYQQPNDSGNGSTASPATTERRCNFTDGNLNTNTGPYTAYHFFASEGATPTVYVVVEMVSGVYRHVCSFGNLIKSNDWTGGEFVCAHLWSQSTAYVDRPANTFSALHLDGLNAADNQVAATVHMEGFPDQGVNEKWGVCISSTFGGTDTAGEARRTLFGTTRSGLYGYSMGWMRASQLNAYKPLMPIVLLYRAAAPNPDTWYWLGEMPDIAIVNMAFFSPGDDITVGSDTYTIFPWVRKRYSSPDSNTEESWNAGLAYKKVI